LGVGGLGDEVALSGGIVELEEREGLDCGDDLRWTCGLSRLDSVGEGPAPLRIIERRGQRRGGGRPRPQRTESHFGLHGVQRVSGSRGGGCDTIDLLPSRTSPESMTVSLGFMTVFSEIERERIDWGQRRTGAWSRPEHRRELSLTTP
jgi:hypothetical protein